MQSLDDLRGLRGLVATCVLSGSVEEEYAAAHEEMRCFNNDSGFRNVEYKRFHCVLVENGRDEVAMHALQQGYDFVLQIDADAAPFAPDSLLRLLQRAYVDCPEADAVGAYCQLKQAPYLPTIDTGTGTWEERYPGEGLLPVIRTGGHFLLTKTSAFRRFGPPWHRTRLGWRPIDALAEVDNFARMKLHGANPFAKSPEWQTLVDEAKKVSGAGPSSVGEDSGFCDALLAAGGRIYVDTDLVVGHIYRGSVTPQMLKDKMEERRRMLRVACGVVA